MSVNSSQFTKASLAALILISVLIIAIVNTENKLCDHYEIYPHISRNDSINGVITNVFNNWSSMHVRATGCIISASMDNKKLSIYASSDGSLAGIGIAEIAGSGDWIYKKPNNDTVWISKKHTKKTLFVLLIKK